MPVTIACPRCARQLQFSSRYLGRTVQCYGCKQTFTAEAPAPAAAAAPAAAFDFGALSTMPKVTADPAVYQAEPGAYGMVRLGIWLILSAITVGALSIVAERALPALISGALSERLSPSEFVAALDRLAGAARVLGLISLIGPGLTLILWNLGNMFCVAAPGVHKARLFAVISFFLGLLVLALNFGPLVLSLTIKRQVFDFEAERRIGQILLFVQLGELVFFLLFLRALAKCIRDPGLGRSAILLLFLGGVVFLLTVSIGLLAGNLGARALVTSESLLQTLRIAFFVDLFLVAGFVLWYLLALFSLQDRLGYTARKQRRDPE